MLKAEPIWLEGFGVRIRVDPHYGARVTSLVDTATGRDWIAPGPASPNTGEDAAYLAAEAVGWDECFPNVDRFDAGAPWSRRLRDHGMLWGRPWQITEQSPASLATRFEHPLFTFARTLRCHESSVTAEYRLASRCREPLPFLWAMHLLLAVQPGDRIALPGVTTVAVGYLASSGDAEPPKQLEWPGNAADADFPLDVVQTAERGFAAKLYVPEVPARAVAVAGTGGDVLGIRWSAPWSSLGIWLNYGGWPGRGDVHHIALEPTSAPGGTFSRHSPVLAPGGALSWRVTLDVGRGAQKT